MINVEPVKGDDTGPLDKFLGDTGTIGALFTTALLLGGKMTVFLSPLGSDKQSLLLSSFATNASTPENQTNWLLNPRRKTSLQVANSGLSSSHCYYRPTSWP